MIGTRQRSPVDRRNLGFLILSAMLLAAAFGCSPDDGDTIDDAAGESISTETTESETVDEGTMSTVVVDRDSSGATGSVEVGLITNLPLVDMSWSQVALPLPDPAPRDLFVTFVGIVDSQLVVAAFGWEAPPSGQQLYTWTSSDGDDWTLSTLDVPRGQYMSRVLAAGDHLIALGDRSTAQSYVPTPFRWDGQGTWEPIDLSSAGVDLEGVEIAGVAATDAGIVLGGRQDQYDPGSFVITFAAKGYEFEVDDFAGTYTMAEPNTGRVVVSGELSEIFLSNDDGQAIYNMETRELITVVPWDVWEGQAVEVSPLPILIPGPEGIDEGLTTIEWDGYVIKLDEGQDEFDVVQDATGESVASGSLADIYRGPSPAFVDPESGQILVEFEWEEWWELLNTARDSADEPHLTHTAQHVVLFSADGTDWSEQVLDTDENFHLDAVLSLNDRFVVNMAEHVEFGATRRAYVSDDGISWVEAGSDGPEYIFEARSGRSGAVALTDLGGASAVAATGDGLNWSTVLFLPVQDDGRRGWLRQVAIGELGQAAMGSFDPVSLPELLSVTVGARTAVFGDSESAVRITDDVNGELLLELFWPELERAAEGGPPYPVTYADGTTSFWSADGSLVMAIPDADAFAAIDERNRRRGAGIEHVVLLELDGVWVEIELPDLDAATPEQLAIGSGRVVIGTNSYSGLGEAAVGNEVGVLIGRIDR